MGGNKELTVSRRMKKEALWEAERVRSGGRTEREEEKERRKGTSRRVVPLKKTCNHLPL